MNSKLIIVALIVGTIYSVEGQINKTLTVNFKCQLILTVNLLPLTVANTTATFTIKDTTNGDFTCCFLTDFRIRNAPLKTLTTGFTVIGIPLPYAVPQPISPTIILTSYSMGFNKDLLDLTHYGYVSSGYCAGSNLTIHTVFKQPDIRLCASSGLTTLQAIYFAAEFTSGLCQGNCAGDLEYGFNPAINDGGFTPSTGCDTVYPDCYFRC